MVAVKSLVTVLALALGVVGCTEQSPPASENGPATSTATTIPPASTVSSATSVAEPNLFAGLESYTSRLAEDGHFSGAVLVAKNGQVLFAEAYGLADRDQGIINRLDTRHRIGSMNKMFTAVAILQLVEAGEVQLDAPVGDYLTDYPNEEVATTVSIHHLLTHTGGTGDIFGPDFNAHRLELRSHADYVELYGERGPAFEPGSQSEYSNYGFVLLGEVIEAVTGQSYYDYVQEHIHMPADMVATGSLPEEIYVPNRSVGYSGPPDGLIPNNDTLPYRGTAAGGGYSTVEDLARFGQALLSHELLSPDATSLLLTAKVEVFPGVGYGYGFEDARDADGYGAVGHGGGAPGMNGDLRLYPESGYVVAVLANMDPRAAHRISTYLDVRLQADE